MPWRLATTLLLLLLKVPSPLSVTIHDPGLHSFRANIHLQILQLAPLLAAVVLEHVARVVIVLLAVFAETVDAELLFLLKLLLLLLMNPNLKLLVPSVRDGALLWRKLLVLPGSQQGWVPKW